MECIQSNDLVKLVQQCIHWFHSCISSPSNLKPASTCPITNSRAVFQYSMEQPLTFYDLSYNQFVGSLTSNMFTTVIKFVYLQHNQLTGTMPKLNAPKLVIFGCELQSIIARWCFDDEFVYHHLDEVF